MHSEIGSTRPSGPRKSRCCRVVCLRSHPGPGSLGSGMPTLGSGTGQFEVHFFEVRAAFGPFYVKMIPRAIFTVPASPGSLGVVLLRAGDCKVDARCASHVGFVISSRDEVIVPHELDQTAGSRKAQSGTQLRLVSGLCGQTWFRFSQPPDPVPGGVHRRPCRALSVWGTRAADSDDGGSRETGDPPAGL